MWRKSLYLPVLVFLLLFAGPPPFAPPGFSYFFEAREAAAMGEKTGSHMVGFRSCGIEARDGTVLNVYVWYPSQRPDREDYSSKAGRWTIRAEKNVKPARGSFPVILFSHDMAGHALFCHDLCSALAEAGFIVAAPIHGEDNVNSAMAMLSAASFYHRPLELLEALHFVVNDPDFKGRVDTGRIGLLGAGIGALTAFQLSGVDLTAPDVAGHCESFREDKAFCNQWAKARLLKVAGDLAEVKGRLGQDSFTPKLSGVKAVGLLAPGGLFLLNQAELGGLEIPVAAVFAEYDQIYPSPLDSSNLDLFFPAPLHVSAESAILEGVDHYGAYAPVPPDIASVLPELVSLSPEDARQESMALRDAFLVDFFRKHLVSASPSAER